MEGIEDQVDRGKETFKQILAGAADGATASFDHLSDGRYKVTLFWPKKGRGVRVIYLDEDLLSDLGNNGGRRADIDYRIRDVLGIG